MKLHSDQFYQEETEKYSLKQIERHGLKKNKKRLESHYSEIAKKISDVFSNKYEMICLGTRNNNERDVFKNLLSNENVFSCDIAPSSNADFVLDFNKLPDTWNEKWDVIFSNAIDHSINATETFWHWFEMLKVGGYMALGFDNSSSVVNDSDCCSFEKKIVDKFFNNNEKFELIEIAKGEIDYYLIKKVSK